MSTEFAPIVQAIRESRSRVSSLRDRGWGIHGSRPWNYELTLGLSRGTLGKMIAELENPVVVDLLAPTDTLRHLFRKHGFKPKLGVAVGLEDKRSEKDEVLDEALGIHQVAGDLSKAQTWTGIQTVLGDNKADIILERGGLGGRTVGDLPSHPAFFLSALGRAWEMLSPEYGVFYAEVPHQFTRRAEELRIFLSNQGVDVFGDGLFLTVIKHPDSPETLRFKNLRTKGAVDTV